MTEKHLYRGKGTPEREKAEFEKNYEAKGKTKEQSDYIYGSVVGKTKRQRDANKMARLRAMRRNDENMRYNMVAKVGLLSVILLGMLSVSAGATNPWNNVLQCTNDWSGGVNSACYGNIVYDTNMALSGDLNVSGNITINSGVNLNLNGYILTIGGTLNNGNGGTITCGDSGNGGGGSGKGGDGSYGCYLQATTIIAPTGSIIASGYNGGGGRFVSSGLPVWGCSGGSTLALGGNPGLSGTSASGSPTITNLFIQQMQQAGFINYLTGAGGGSGGWSSGCNNGGSIYGIYAYGGSGGGGGQGSGDYGVAGGTAGGGGGGGGVVFEVWNTLLSGGTPVLSGGSGGSGANGASNGAGGGAGRILTYQYTVPPLTTPFLYPAVNTIAPTNVLELSSTTFTINVIKKTYPIANVMIQWGDGTSNVISSSVS